MKKFEELQNLSIIALMNPQFMNESSKAAVSISNKIYTACGNLLCKLTKIIRSFCRNDLVQSLLVKCHHYWWSLWWNDLFSSFFLLFWQEADFICLTACLMNKNGHFAYNFIREICVKVSTLCISFNFVDNIFGRISMLMRYYVTH